jgi:hypothetical protein
MKYIREYQLFEASATAPALTAEQIEWLDKCVKRKWKLNRQTGFVDVDGDFDCSEQGLTDFKGVKFGDVSGNFRCSKNQLTTLEGAPQNVYGNFFCGDNQLTSLVGAPQWVIMGFSFRDNPVSESTLDAIFTLMRKRMSYQQALEKLWPDMGNEDRVLMYKQMPSLSPEDARKYKALATYSNIKGYL